MITLEEVYDHVYAIQQTVVYDDTPSPEEAIRLLNKAAAFATGLLEMIHADLYGHVHSLK